MAEVLPRYGELQRDLGPHVGRHGTADDRETVRRAEAMAGRFGEWCERLGGAAVGASLDHNDLHLWNVLVDPAPPGRSAGCGSTTGGTARSGGP